MIFDLLINLIEAICISIIVSICLKNSKIYIILQSIIILLITSFYDYDNLTFVLVCSIFLSVVIFTYIFLKKFDFSIFLQIILALIINSFCNLCALLFVSLLTQLPVYAISANDLIFKEATILSKLINLLLAYGLVKKNIYFKRSKINYLFILLMIDVMVIIHTLMDAIVYGTLDFNTIQVLSVSFLVFTFLFMIIIYFVSKLNDKNLKMKNLEIQERTINNNLVLLDGMTSKLMDMEHRINYVLLLIKNMIVLNNKEEALKIIDDNVWKINKVNYYVNTKNPYFDNLLASTLKKMYDKKINPIVICECSENVLDNHIVLVSSFIEFLNQLCNCLNENNSIKISLFLNKNSIVLTCLITNFSNDYLSCIKINQKELLENNVSYFCKKIGNSSFEFKFVMIDIGG